MFTRLPHIATPFVVAAAMLTCVSHGDAQESSLTEQINAHAVLRPTTASDDDEAPVVSAVAVSPDGRLLVTAGDDHLIRVWRLADGSLLNELTGHADWIRSLAINADGGMLASAGDDRRIRLWNMETGQMIRALRAHESAVFCVRFDPSGARLAAIGFERHVRIYDATTGHLEHTLDGGCPDLRALAYSPDGHILAVAGRDGKILWFDPATGALTKTISAHGRRIRALAFSANGSLLASAGDGLQIRAWDLTGAQRLTTPTRPGHLLSLAFCGPRHVAAGGSDNVIRVYEIDNGREAYRLVGHTGTIASLAYHEGMGLLVSGSFDTTARLWKVPPHVREETARVPDAAPRGR